MTPRLRACLDCGRLSPATRCPTHTMDRQRAAEQKRDRPGSTARGYGAAHQRATAAAIAAEPWCHTHPTCGYPQTAGTPANPLTGGHPRLRAECETDEQWRNQEIIPQCARDNYGKRPVA